LSAGSLVNRKTITFSGQGGLGTISVFGGFDNENSIAVENGYTFFLNASDFSKGSVFNNGIISVGSGGRLIVDGLSRCPALAASSSMTAARWKWPAPLPRP
jgi:hypothetical protein